MRLRGFRMAERITAAQYNAKSKKRSKYGAKKTVVDGITFASKKEAARWVDLNRLQDAGDIGQLERQVPIVLQGQNGAILTKTGRERTYVADFKYIDWRLNGVWVIEDSKGYPTPEFELKMAILAAQNVVLTIT